MLEKWLEPYTKEVREFYGKELTDEQVKRVIKDILDRYCNAEYFEPEFDYDIEISD